LIGRPNVGKSTLFNRLAGESLSLVDDTPGLTRDRKETTIKLFGVKIRLVDTAGINDFEEQSSYENLINGTINQTRRALVYSDLAFFILDSREGVSFTDIKLAKWLNKVKLLKDHPESKQNLKLDEISSSDEFYKKLKSLKEEDEIKIPKILLVANKTENNYVPSEIFSDFQKLNLGEPILISAQQGDNMHEIYDYIEKNIPENFKNFYEEKVEKRLERYFGYKKKLKDEFLKSLENLPKDERNKYSIKDWEKDFDYLNKFDLDDNSDYDSDNDVDPLDTLIEVPKDPIIRENMKKAKKSESGNEEFEQDKKLHNKINYLKNYKRPIKIAVVGKQNVGKSSVINSLLKENRVIISDIPGTTRDSIPIQWIYKGRRIILTDTAGLKPKNHMHEKIERMASASTIKSIKYSHVIIYVINAMEAFSPMDMKLIEFIGEQGRAIVIVANKWDLVGNGFRTKAKKWMEDQLEKGCNQYKDIRISFVSAKNFIKIDNVMDDVLNAYSAWNTRISTNVLNHWINEVKKITSIPNKDGEHLKLKFATQIKTRPPAFTVFVNNIDIFFKSHESFLKKMMIKEFNLKFSPIRFLLRDHKKISQKDEFKKVSISTAKIQKKLDLFKKKMSNPTYRRKATGYDNLYGKKSIYRQMKK
jgi:GTP-binding protein